MHVNVSLLSYVSDHLFLHDSRLFFEIDYEIIFSCLKQLARNFFRAKLRFNHLNDDEYMKRFSRLLYTVLEQQ